MTRIAFLSHTAAGGVFKVGSHHLSREFAAAGHEVAHVSTPVSLAHLQRVRRDQQTKIRLRTALRPYRDADVKHLVPLTLLPLGKTPMALRRAQASLWKQTRSDVDRPDVLFLDQPLLIDYAIALRPKTLIYRPTDAHFDRESRLAELRALEVAQGIAATSSRTLESVVDGTDWCKPAVVIENGVEFERFALPELGPHGNGVVYLGALDNRFDWGLVDRLAEKFPEIPFVVAGPLGRHPALRSPNVKIVGAVPYETAPELLRRFAVGILPLADVPANEGRSPMKYYEYLASGLSVVATRVPALAERTDPNVWLYSDDAGAVSALSQALGASQLQRQLGVEAARQKSWASCAGALEQFSREVSEAHPHE